MDAITGAGNQRIVTMLLYLNDDFTGGETVLPDLGLTVRLKKGETHCHSGMSTRAATGRLDATCGQSGRFGDQMVGGTMDSCTAV